MSVQETDEQIKRFEVLAKHLGQAILMAALEGYDLREIESYIIYKKSNGIEVRECRKDGSHLIANLDLQ